MFLFMLLAGGLHCAATVTQESTEPRTGPRVGAVFSDGWRSSAIGSGACSHHGGVREWVHSTLPPASPHPDTDRELADNLFWFRNAAAAALGLLLVTSLVGSGRTAVSPEAPNRAFANETRSQSASDTLSAPPSIQHHAGACSRCGAPLERRTEESTSEPYLSCTRFPACNYFRAMPSANADSTSPT